MKAKGHLNTLEPENQGVCELKACVILFKGYINDLLVQEVVLVGVQWFAVQ